MSAFNDFIAASQAEAFVVIGSVSVTIGAGTYDAIVDQYAMQREIDLEGFEGEYDGTAFIQLAALSGLASPIERTLENKSLTVAGRVYRIERAVLDSAGVTLGLKSEQKHNPPLGTSQGV